MKKSWQPLLPLAMAGVLFAMPALAQEPAAAPEPAPIMSEQADAALDQALSGVSHEDFALTFRPYFFPSLQGGTLAMIGFEMGRGELTFGLDSFSSATGAAAATAPTEVAQLELFGVVLQGGNEIARFGDEFSVPRESVNGELTGVQSFGDTLAAGSYEIVWGVRDRVSDVTASRRDTIDVPDLMGSGLTTSSVLMVVGSPMPAPGLFAPHQVYGGVRVLTVAFPDDVDRVFAADTPSLMLTYIVAGAQFDPAAQGFNLELNYSIVTTDGENVWRVAPQSLNRPTVGQEIPLSQIDSLEAGAEYVFEILVKDLAAGTESTTRVPFRIAS